MEQAANRNAEVILEPSLREFGRSARAVVGDFGDIGREITALDGQPDRRADPRLNDPTHGPHAAGTIRFEPQRSDHSFRQRAHFAPIVRPRDVVR
jgi:hypothetical protein